MLTYESLLQNFTSWALAEPGLRAALVIGSRARTDHPADAWSDLDLILFLSAPQTFMHATDWVSSIGPVWLSFLELAPDGCTWERRVLYAGGLDVDYILNSVQSLESMLADGIPCDLAGLIQRGRCILVDKDGRLGELLARPLSLSPDGAQAQATQAQFSNLVNDFWYHSVWAVKHLRRGETWRAKRCCDGYLKDRLLTMLEWHARATRSPCDPWSDGRFLEQWADPRAVQALSGVFAHYEPADIARGLWATMDLFRLLGLETAQRLGFPYPAEGDHSATDLVFHLLEEGGLPVRLS